MSGRWLPSLRRLSVFYFFLLAMAVGLVAYYFFFIPKNKSQFASRASRELKTLVYNFKKQVRDLDSTFSQPTLHDTANWKKFRNREEPYSNLYENFAYEVADSQNVPLKRLDKTGGDWKLGFPVRRPDVALPLTKFGNLFFSSRTGIFDSYVVLRHGANSTHWEIVYRNPLITTSDQLILDTSNGLYHNTDMSAIVEVIVGGKPYKLFMQPFTLGEEQLVMGGLITKRDYADYVYTIGTDVIIVTIILIVLVLIILPMLKIYFLSPNERIYSRDVIACTASLFIGTAAVLLILVFEYLVHISSDSLHTRMIDVGKQIKKDVEQQLDSANKQLEFYINAYSNLPSRDHKMVLDQEKTDPVIMHQIDSMFHPDIFPELTRVLWVDSLGNTMAKWNPFNFTTPLTNVKEYEFFKRLQAIHQQRVPRETLVVYSGKSNLTGEFQVYIAKPTTQLIYKGREYPSIGVLMATSLHCNTFPVLPPGFGFCIMDENGEVLLHSDERRNLAENIFVETGYDQRVIRSIELDRNALITNVNLYGKSHDLVIRSINDQPLSIVVFYARKDVISNISRFLHFSIIYLLYLFAVIAAFIFYFSYRKIAPSKLRFSLNTEEWIRPSASNQDAYRFTHVFFTRLIAVAVVAISSIQLFRLDYRNILFLSILLPFYGMMALIIARKKLINEDKASFDLKDYFRQKNEQMLEAKKKRILFSFLYKQGTSSMPILALVLLLANIACIISLNKERGDGFIFSIITLIGIQCVFVVLLFRYLKRISRPAAQSVQSAPSAVEWDPSRVPNNYLRLLYFTLIIAAVLPCFGITTYAFFAEKMQYKKTKELFIASQFERKYLDLQTRRATYKPYLRELDSVQRIDSILLTKGIYLSDRDSISVGKNVKRNTGAIYDGPYQNVLNRIYGYTMPLFGEFAIGDSSGDGNSWKFGTNKNCLFLYYKGKGQNPPDIAVQSSFRNPLQNFLLVLRSGGIIFPIVIGFFLVFLYWCTRDLMRRLLLLEFVKPVVPKRNFLQEYLEKNSLDPLYSARGEKYLTVESIQEEEKPGQGQDEYILKLNFKLAPVYSKIWEDLSENEKFILYDLCSDGFTNYKNTDTFYQLLTKGILVFDDYKVKPFSLSFRNFVLAQKDSEKMQGILKKYSIGGVWRSLRVPILLIAGIITVFFVLTQNEVAQDLTAFISSLVAIIPLLIQFLGRNSSKDQQ